MCLSIKRRKIWLILAFHHDFTITKSLFYRLCLGMKKYFKLKFLFLFLSFFCFAIWFFLLLRTNLQKSDFFSFLEKPNQYVDLVVGGDIMLSRGIWWWGKKEGYDRIFTGNNYHPLSQFSCYLSWSCLLFFNLESPFSLHDNDQPKWGFLFRAHPKNLEVLDWLRWGNQLLLSLANNHTNNAWGAGIALTRDLLSGAGVWFFGAGKDTQEARKIYQIEKNWIQICFQAYSYDGNFDRYGGVPLAWNPLKKDLILEDLDLMHAQGCEVKVLSLHRGAEYRIQPNAQQKQLAHDLIDAGADLILWGHSHIPWRYENYKGKSVFYSFWNFIFDQDRGKKAKEKGFDYVFDHELGRKTVPTYIPLLAHIRIEKVADQILLHVPEFRMARLNKWIFSPLDHETFHELIQAIVPLP